VKQLTTGATAGLSRPKRYGLFPPFVAQTLCLPRRKSRRRLGDLVKEIDKLVGSRPRSSFLTQAAERELMRLRQLKALDAAAGSWKDSDHPELKSGSAKWVRSCVRNKNNDFKK
jgi:hypothetical protein